MATLLPHTVIGALIAAFTLLPDSTLPELELVELAAALPWP
jgi:hypothetical protein